MKKIYIPARQAFITLITCVLLTFVIATAYAIIKHPPPELFSKLHPYSAEEFPEAIFWQSTCAGIKCNLCPIRCFLPEGARGVCKVYINSGGSLRTLVYARPVTVHVDPIEKKPVYHLLPGSRTFSIATAGCNLGCTFCQNWTISQIYPEQEKGIKLSPEEIVKKAIESKSLSIAFTYSEPVVFYEYMLETARLAKKAGLKNVMVSAGYINYEPLKKLAPYFDVIKIDLKGFNKKFYKKYVKGDLKYVLATLKYLKEFGVLTEVVNLVVPTLNDDPKEITQMTIWIRENLGADTPVFFSRFTPQYKVRNLPPTPLETLQKAREIALSEGLNFVYIGNVPGIDAENTYCPRCGNIVVGRHGYFLTKYALKGNRCFYCGREIPGVWHKDTENMRRPLEWKL